MSKTFEDWKDDFKNYDAKQALEDLRKIKIVDKHILLTIFAKIRILLDYYGDRENFKCLNSYVNLILHGSIRKSKTIYHFKDYIDSQITEISKASESNDPSIIIKLFSSFFKMFDLKNDITTFFKKYDVSTFPVNGIWPDLQVKIIQALLYKMIEINSDKQVLVNNNICYVKSFVFHIYDERGIGFLGDTGRIGFTVFFEDDKGQAISITSQYSK